MRKKSIFLNKVLHQTENWFVAVELDGLVRIIYGMVVLKGITLLVLEEDAGHMACGIGIMVAISSQVATMERGEVLLLSIYLLEKLIATHSLVAALAVLNGTVVANHIYIK